MSLISRLTPTNLLEEKEKFFADHTYNPQFKYAETFTSEELYKYGLPKPELVEKAKGILDQVFSQYTENELERSHGSEINQTEVTQKINIFLKAHNLEKLYSITYSSSFIARASVTANTIKLRTPVKFRENDLLGMIYHELGTHALRQINYEQQPWYKKKKKFGFGHYLITEEGLAVIHSLIPHKIKYAYKPARYYLAAHLAQSHGFAELYSKLTPIIIDPEKRWTATLRQKRGLEDTSIPGGFTKDLVYFQGLVEMYHWLSSNNFRLEELYFGKIAKEDAQKAVSLNQTYKPILPSFYITNKEKYIENIVSIGRVNVL